MARTLVIAEVGSTHDREYPKAHSLVSIARHCGADIVKFQFWSSAHRLADRRRVPVEYRDIYTRYAIPESWLFALKFRADADGIEFMCSTYLPEDVAVVAPFVKRFKIASFEAMDQAFASAHKPFIDAGTHQVIVSLGMGASASHWWGHPAVDRLHCVSAYPAPAEALNLSVLRGRGDVDDVEGFSDHSDPALTWTGALAVAAGASIVEAHLKLEETDPANPDAPHAMTPRQFTEYVRHIRFAETCLGDGVRQLQACEREMANYRVNS